MLYLLLLGGGTVADIFISYSKADRDKVVMLATYLEFRRMDRLVGHQSG